MAQTVRPTGTVTATNWSAAGLDISVPHVTLDESVVNDADYISTSTNGAVAEFLLATPSSTPSTGTVTVYVRGRMQPPATAGTMTVALYNGSTLLGTDTVAFTDTLTTTALTFSTSLTNWDALRVRITASGLDGQARVTWLYAELADAASSIACGGPAAHLMTNTCNVVRGTETQSSTSGGLVTAWATVYSSVCCAIQGSSSREAMNQARETGVAAYDVLFPPGADVRHGDRLTNFAGSAGLAASARLAVVGNPIDEGGRSAYVFVPAVYETGEVVS